MEVTIFLAKIFAIYFIVMSLAMLFRKDYFKGAICAISKDSGLSLFSAIVTMIAGSLLVLFHNVWVFAWPVVITVLCWLVLVKGVVKILYPEVEKCDMKMCADDTVYLASGFIGLGLGIYLAVMGFFS